MPGESRHDILLRRVQLIVGILAGLATLIFGVYNIQKNMLAKPGPPAQTQTPAESPLRSALEEAGASFIRTATDKYAKKNKSS